LLQRALGPDEDEEAPLIPGETDEQEEQATVQYSPRPLNDLVFPGDQQDYEPEVTKFGSDLVVGINTLLNALRIMIGVPTKLVDRELFDAVREALLDLCQNVNLSLEQALSYGRETGKHLSTWDTEAVLSWWKDYAGLPGLIERVVASRLSRQQ